MTAAGAPAAASAGYRLDRLRLDDFRLLDHAELAPAPARTLIVGGNGAGKTSLLEAVYLLTHGRSFRGGSNERLIRSGQAAFTLYAEWRDPIGRLRRGGLQRRAGSGWEAKLDGQAVAGLGDLYRSFSAVCFEPGSHELLAGPAEARRRFMDWALFHVEPRFLEEWRRYHRALRQRNALLKRDAIAAAELAVWEQELSTSGESLSRWRGDYVQQLQGPASALAARLLPELGNLRLDFSPGWGGDSLTAALERGRQRDRRLGHTGTGPHRAELLVRFDALPAELPLSRGQEKLAALALVLGQAEDLAARGLGWPLLLLDDLASELDRIHQHRVWDWLLATPAQILATATEAPPDWPEPGAVFHVEQGRLKQTGSG